MDFYVKDWAEIADKYERAGLVAGNGLSIHISQSFSYPNIFEQAKAHLSKDELHFFIAKFTMDFEEIISFLESEKYNDTASHSIEKIENYLKNIKRIFQKILILNIKKIQDGGKLKAMSEFLMHFKVVCCLNYDTVVYSSMLNKSECMNDGFRPGNYLGLRFLNDKFSSDWKDVKKTTLVFPHGNLFYYQEGDFIKKLKSGDINFLDTIDKQLNDDKVSLTVMEGQSSHKIKCIKKNDYLKTVFEKLSDMPENLVFYGWGMAERDTHIKEKIFSSAKTKRIAISVLPHEDEICRNKIFYKISELWVKTHGWSSYPAIEFFCAHSIQSWYRTKYGTKFT
ncbi:MAG: DUF4917 family protein [Pseudomonadota bacterium]